MNSGHDSLGKGERGKWREKERTRERLAENRCVLSK
jgi:hypothetical protein